MMRKRKALQEARNNLVRGKYQKFIKRTPGRYTAEEYQEMVDLALEWAGFPTVRFEDGSLGVVHAPAKLMQVLDMLNHILVKRANTPALERNKGGGN